MSGGLDKPNEPQVCPRPTFNFRSFLNAMREEYSYSIPCGYEPEDVETLKGYLNEAIANALARFVECHD